MVTYGPVPSRRFGRSLGINNIPPKTCSYACRYCQVGRTIHKSIERRAFYAPDMVVEEVRRRVEEVTRLGERIDVLAFVPDGEPTLDRNLGREMDLLRPLGIEIAVISNGSLVTREDVRSDLSLADIVSLKIDATRRSVWRRMDRPHGHLDLEEILEGMLRFAAEYDGRLLTETMLVKGVNDGPEDLEDVASFLAKLRPAVAYLSVPTRPPAVHGVRAPDEASITRAWHALARGGATVECLTGYEGNDFALVGSVEETILGTTSVHPMREDALKLLLSRAHADWSVVRRLVDGGELAEVIHDGHTYFVRRFSRSRR
jgi:wyosine [tRNA(Phe)-imidazoG37] synthetase (radical SAM superfamily)